MTILITGGTGFLGQHLARALLRRGERVRILGRNFSSCADLLAAGATAIAADLSDKPAIVAACAGTRLVYHVGALSAPWGRRADFFAANVGGTEAVVAGCRAHKVARLVHVSSPSVIFDGRNQYQLTEDAPYPRRFISTYSLTKKLGEDLVNAAAADGLDTVILRPKAIFGPGDHALLPRLIAAAQAGRLPQIGDGQNRVDLTYVDNVVDALLLAGESRDTCGRTYTITNGEHIALWDLIRQLLHHLGIRTQLRQVPLSAALAVAGLLEAQAALNGREPLLTRYTVALLGRTQTYNIAAARHDLGYEPGISVAAGVERTLFTFTTEARRI